MPRDSHKSVPARVSYHKFLARVFPQLRVSYQECPTIVSHQTVLQECSHNSVPPECLTRAFLSESLPQGCLIRVSHKCVSQECSQSVLPRVSHRTVPQECLGRVFPQECHTTRVWACGFTASYVLQLGFQGSICPAMFRSAIMGENRNTQSVC